MMRRKFLLGLGLLAAVAPAVAWAALPAPTVSVDPRFAVAFGGVARTDFASGFASDTANGAATDGDRLYAVGEADGNVAIIAHTPTGGYDAGFSGDGKLTLPVSADPSRDAGQAIVGAARRAPARARDDRHRPGDGHLELRRRAAWGCCATARRIRTSRP